MKAQQLVPLLLLAACHSAPPALPVDDTVSDAAAQPVSPDAVALPQAPVGAGRGLSVPSRLRATGTEPFWSATVDGAALIYRTPEFPNGVRITVARRDAKGVAAFVGALDGKPLALEIAPGACSDGMSDRIYSFTAVRQIGPDIARGCANPL